MAENKKLSFEESMKRLEEISTELSSEGVSLEKALALYEEGVKLVRACNKTLDDTERKIKILQINSDGEMTEKDFCTSDAE